MSEFDAIVGIKSAFSRKQRNRPSLPAGVLISCTAGVLGFVVLGFVTLAFAQPVLHELFAPDPQEDQRFGATTSSGLMPAAMQTKSGWVNAPDPTERVGETVGDIYGGVKSAAGAGEDFILDNITSRPTQVKYDEPFRPSILPYKRMFAFDAVQDTLALSVSDEDLVELPVGGVAAETEDAFFGDFEVNLVAGVPVRIPTVGPGARLLSLQVDPPRSVRVLRDSADNWYMRAEQGGTARVFVQLSIDRRSFGSPFAPVNRRALAAFVRPLPKRAATAAGEVMNHIGELGDLTPAGALRALVGYFRSFQESDDLPVASQPLELYKEISLTQKGVCRHRAYAFVITALAWGIPARLVHNEAHAWVEVFDTEVWHRIDLGGAATDLIPSRNEPMSVRHRPPTDPFTWPTSERPAAVEFERRLAQTRPAALGLGSPAENAPQSGTSSQGTSSPGDNNDPSGFSWNDPGATSDDSAGNSSTNVDGGVRIALRVEGSSYRRGTPVHVSGRASEQNSPCALSRIDVRLMMPSGPKTIGSLATDRTGRFSGQVTLPASIPVGTVALSAQMGGGCRKL